MPAARFAPVIEQTRGARPLPGSLKTVELEIIAVCRDAASIFHVELQGI